MDGRATSGPPRPVTVPDGPVHRSPPVQAPVDVPLGWLPVAAVCGLLASPSVAWMVLTPATIGHSDRWMTGGLLLAAPWLLFAMAVFGRRRNLAALVSTQSVLTPAILPLVPFTQELVQTGGFRHFLRSVHVAVFFGGLFGFPVLGAIIGLMIGWAFSFPALPLTLAVRRASGLRTDDASDALLLAGGGLMAVVAAVGALVIPKASVAMACCAPVGLFVALRSMVRVDCRLTHLRTLRSRMQGVERASLDQGLLPSIGLRLTDADDVQRAGAIALCEPPDGRAGTYRAVERPEVLALLPRDVEPSWMLWLKSWYWPSEMSVLRGIALWAALVAGSYLLLGVLTFVLVSR